MGEQSQGAGASTDDAGATAVRKAGEDKRLNGGEERSALDYLLGAPEPAHYTVRVQFGTPEGLKPLIFHFDAMDGRKIDKIEQANLSQATGRMDKAAADAQLVVEAVKSIEDPGTGKTTQVTSEEFRTVKPGDPPLASSVDALYARFGKQIALIAGVSNAIREAAGWGDDRVGKADRVLVDAAGN